VSNSDAFEYRLGRFGILTNFKVGSYSYALAALIIYRLFWLNSYRCLAQFGFAVMLTVAALDIKIMRSFHFVGIAMLGAQFFLPG